MIRARLAVVGGLVVLAGVAGIGALRGGGDPDEAPRCAAREARHRDWPMDDESTTEWSDIRSRPGAPGSVVLADAPEGEVWRYREVALPPASRVALDDTSRHVVEGEVARGRALDERTVVGFTDWSPSQGSRRVILGEDVWSDDTRSAGWRHCRAGEAPDGPALSFRFQYHPDAEERYRATCTISDCLVRLYPGTRVPVADPINETVNGEVLTTYEITGITLGHKDPTRLRATMTVDEGRRLRAVKVWDTKTGQVYATFEAAPAPDHPPISDPSGEPPFSQQPVPPPPDLGTVPPGTRPPSGPPA